MNPALRVLASPVATFVALQAGWWACVLGAAAGRPLAGPLAVSGLLVLQLAAAQAAARRALGTAVLGLALVGTLLDSLQSAAGFVRFAGSSVPWLAPAWITALWAQFATALPGLVRLSGSPPWLLAGLAGLGAPLAYWGGARMGAATLPHGLLGLASVGLEWAIALPLAAALSRRYQETAP